MRRLVEPRRVRPARLLLVLLLLGAMEFLAVLPWRHRTPAVNMRMQRAQPQEPSQGPTSRRNFAASAAAATITSNTAKSKRTTTAAAHTPATVTPAYAAVNTSRSAIAATSASGISTTAIDARPGTQSTAIMAKSSSTNATTAAGSSVTTAAAAAAAMGVVSMKVATFYYPWYGNPSWDGKWAHWDHDQLEHWDPKIREKFPHGEASRRRPPGGIGSNFYPELGPYASRDPVVIATHMAQIAAAGIGVVAVSWYPPGTQDPAQNGHELAVEDGSYMARLFTAAGQHGLQVALHVEPYQGRRAATLRRDLQYVAETYLDKQPALQRWQGSPVYYLYDQYRLPAAEWATLFDPSAPNTIRGTALDGVFLCLLVERSHLQYAVAAHCDGVYTYFASPISWGASPRNWPEARRFCAQHGLLFAPSVGPGYVDTRVRPWNGQATKGRNRGQYYDAAWRAAIDARPDWIGVTSFNEWHEGTQIEPAAVAPPRDGMFRYETYADAGGSDTYLRATRRWVHAFDTGVAAPR